MAASTLSWVGSLINAQAQTPRLEFRGDDFAKIASAVYAETVQDMRNKIEYGDNEKFPAGFFHTSTEEAGVPQYYNDMWSRDCGRGVIELCRIGYKEDALMIARYILDHKNMGDHWAREMHHSQAADKCELDGNALILSAICSVWEAWGRNLEVGRELCAKVMPVAEWADDMVRKSPYGGLLPSSSELSGNPNTPYQVYSIFGNYGMYVAGRHIAEMAGVCGVSTLEKMACNIADSIGKGLSGLVSDRVMSAVPEGCWINGIDERTGKGYDTAEWDGTTWPCWHWTRQLPYVLNYDYDDAGFGPYFNPVQRASYEFIKSWMIKGEYFRKYGFVSNSAWTGMGGRHDDTMGGYGQGFFTQAALMADDVNTYSKCLEGIARLGYDGNVLEQMSYEKNPFLMHECFNYDNYEQALDHTFGVHSEGRPEIMENPGDEGNLAQESEIIKAFHIVAGIRSDKGRLVIMPRLPWLWDTMNCVDWPVIDAKGREHRVDFTIKHERWLRRCTVTLSGASGFDGVDIRVGPFPRQIRNPHGYEIEQTGDVSWIWLRDIKATGRSRSFTIEL